VAHSITLAAATLGFVHVPQKPVEAAIALSIVFVAAEILRLPGHGFLTLSSRGTSGERVGERGNPENDLLSPTLSSSAGGEGGLRVPGLTARWPWLIAFTFGLLHGFGFAGALNQVGLPQNAIPVALLFFNLGVEAGQLLFIAAVLVVVALARKALGKRHGTIDARFPWAGRVPPYAIGGVAAFWLIQRIAAFGQ
jgi:HupE / UreJ protein